MQYGSQGGYGSPQGGYGGPQSGYGNPPSGYEDLDDGFGAPVGRYGNPTGGYGQPQRGQAPMMGGRGAMAVPHQGQMRPGGGPARRRGKSRGKAAEAPKRDIFSALGPGIEALLQPLEKVEIDAQSLRKLTATMEGLSAEVSQTWKNGVEKLIAQPPGLRDAMKKLRDFFGLLPLQVDSCCKMLEMRRVELGVPNATERRNRVLAVAALGSYARSQSGAIQATMRTDQKLYRDCVKRLRDDMAKGSLHAQLVLSFMKSSRGRGAM